MRQLKAIFALAIFIAMATGAAASTGYMTGAKLFGYQAVPPGIGFSVENFTCGGKTAYSIVAYDEPMAFFTLNSSQSAIFPGIRPTTDAAAIGDALDCYYMDTGHNPNLTDSFTKIHAEIFKLEGNAERGEQGCRILLGTDRTECVSFESCQKACYSVTSFCQPVALGAGRNFVNEIWAFENNSRALKKAYSTEKDAYIAFMANASKETALGYIDAVNDTLSVAERAASSPLFYDYSYCFSPDYPVYSLYVLETRAERQYQDSSVFYGIQARSREIANQTAMVIEKKTKYRIPTIEESPAVCSGCRNGTLDYEEDSTPTQSFIADFLNGIASFILSWAKPK